MDNNVGQNLKALDDADLTKNTVVVYTSDHSDNVGARGLWGKSQFYQESTAIEMIMAGPGVGTGLCENAREPGRPDANDRRAFWWASARRPR